MSVEQAIDPSRGVVVEDVFMVPRGEYAIRVGSDAILTVRRCLVSRPVPYGAWRRPRLRRVGEIISRLRVAREAWNWTKP